MAPLKNTVLMTIPLFVTNLVASTVEERLLTGPEAGITRDAISIQLDWQGIPMRVFDTAGMRKKAKINLMKAHQFHQLNS